MDKWHGKEGGGTADFEEWGHTELPARHAQAELADTALAHWGQNAKNHIDAKSGIPLSVALETARIWTSIHSTVSLRACFYVFTNTHS